VHITCFVLISFFLALMAPDTPDGADLYFQGKIDAADAAFRATLNASDASFFLEKPGG
jgi:hypothetical protein